MWVEVWDGTGTRVLAEMKADSVLAAVEAWEGGRYLTGHQLKCWHGVDGAVRTIEVQPLPGGPTAAQFTVAPPGE